MLLDEIKCVGDIYEFCLGTKRELVLKLQSDNLITNNYLCGNESCKNAK